MGADHCPAGPDVGHKRPEAGLLRDDRVADQVTRDHVQLVEHVLHAVDRRHMIDRGMPGLDRRGPVELFLGIDHHDEDRRRTFGKVAMLM
jgi:hypothetical protein